MIDKILKLLIEGKEKSLLGGKVRLY